MKNHKKGTKKFDCENQVCVENRLFGLSNYFSFKVETRTPAGPKRRKQIVHCRWSIKLRAVVVKKSGQQTLRMHRSETCLLPLRLLLNFAFLQTKNACVRIAISLLLTSLIGEADLQREPTSYEYVFSPQKSTFTFVPFSHIRTHIYVRINKISRQNFTRSSQ